MKNNKKLMRIVKIIMVSLGILTAAAIAADWYFAR